MKCFPTCLLIVALISHVPGANAQSNTYILNGSAKRDDCNCYTLTNAVTGQSGSVWNSSKIDLSSSFDFVFNVFLGCKDAEGADGIVFILQPLSTGIGAVGGGMGFYGVTPSVGIALDTWKNDRWNDPAADHISIQLNGNSNHQYDLAGPVQASAANVNIEDCKWHTLRITWDAATHWLKSYFDGAMRVQAKVDIVSDVFRNDPMVYWGFGASTGAYYNQQKFCTVLNSAFVPNFINDAACVGNDVIFKNQSESFAPVKQHQWEFGDGSTSTAASAQHKYTAPGLYTVTLTETGLDGCSDTASRVIEIGDFPTAAFDIFDTCAGKLPRIIDRSSVSNGVISSWTWKLDGNMVSASQNAQLTDVPAGYHSLVLTVQSNHQCASDEVVQNFNIKPSPVISARAENGCVNLPVQFEATQMDNATTITKWNWQLDNGQRSAEQNPVATYSRPGYYKVYATATASNGCESGRAQVPLFINKAKAYAGNDTVILGNQPLQLQASGGVSYTWSPGIGLNNQSNSNPVVLLDQDATFTLMVRTAEGCEDQDEINIKIFRGSGVIVPTAFTPNKDGLNEKLKPVLKGIKRLEQFAIYNRWGQLLFSSNDISEGWNGEFKGEKQATGVYIWSVRAVDYAGKAYNTSGYSTLIR